MNNKKQKKVLSGFEPVSPKVNFPELEEAILRYWKENHIFEKSISSKPEDKKWTFLDGPPFVTGMPHYGSLLSSLPKDVFGRYWTMKGYRVRRVWGWDGHGLPIENKVEGKLDIKRKKDIEEKIGVDKFIEECKKYVEVVSDEWEWYVDRIGRWVDFKNAYKTWDIPYMESVMWVFKQMYEKGYIYKGLRVSLYCPHCATPISNFEVAMDADNYKDIVDPGTIYKYPLADEKNTYILAWSTTPWNKIVTPALAVNPDLVYIKVKQFGEYYILAKSTLKILKSSPHPYPLPQGEGQEGMQVPSPDEGYEIVDEFLGKELVGKRFIPHYDYYPLEPGEKAFIIIGGEFVTADEGTGVVTIAAYGEEDLVAMKKDKIHIEMHLDEEGTIKRDVPKFGGMYYLKANKAVEEDLEKRGLIYQTADYTHKVPLCWRCHTRLYYAPQDAWFVDVQQLKPMLKKTNETVNWFPKHFKYGRFLKSLENAPDWNISRSRYWGSPVPVWECDCGERYVPGSIKELEEVSGQNVFDLHKPAIDEVIINCRKCGKKVNRVSEVLDSWIEAGSASFAERHFPFAFMRENRILRYTQDDPALKLELDRFFPPDFIAEYTGQIRAWFYVLHCIGGALFESKAFKNVIVEGVILGTDGRKMSKNYGNYPDPKEMLQKYGGDALRLYLLGSPVMRGEDIIISEEQYRNQVKGSMLILWNVFNFFVTYANTDKWQRVNRNETDIKSENVLDKWVLSLLNRTVKEVTVSLEGYDTLRSIELIREFIDNLSKWYIRRSRDRVGPSAGNEIDRSEFYTTTYIVLITLTKLLAPIAPFIAEEIYRNLTGKESVHLEGWPIQNDQLINDKLEEQMRIARKVVEYGHAVRKINQQKVRQPLKEIVLHMDGDFNSVSDGVWEVVLQELNIKNLVISGKKRYPDKEVIVTEEDLKLEGEARDIIRSIQEERKKLGMKIDEQVSVTLPAWPEKFEDNIKKSALAKTLIKGEKLVVIKIPQ